jgi:hypothetical protein
MKKVLTTRLRAFKIIGIPTEHFRDKEVTVENSIRASPVRK